MWKVHYSKTGLSYVYCVFVNTCNFYLVTVIFFFVLASWIIMEKKKHKRKIAHLMKKDIHTVYKLQCNAFLFHLI